MSTSGGSGWGSRGCSDLMKVFLDPLSGEHIDLDAPKVDATTQQVINASYDVYFGWQWVGQQGMFKVGDRFTCVDPRTKITYSYDALVDDRDTIGGAVLGTHPDADGVMQLSWVQEGDTSIYDGSQTPPVM